MKNLVFDGRAAGVVSIFFTSEQNETKGIAEKLTALECVLDVTI